ncbi:MAG: hypothetical protein AAF974_10300 [Cyanobacteria bacterium P01_E01_bin.34]
MQHVEEIRRMYVEIHSLLEVFYYGATSHGIRGGQAKKLNRPEADANVSGDVAQR